MLARMDACLKANGADPFVTGQHLTVGDLKFAHQIHNIANGTLEHFPENYLDKFPHVKLLHDAVYNHPKVKEYYSPKVITAIWFTPKEGELDNFTNLYVQNPYNVLTTKLNTPDANPILYTLGHANGMQGTAIVWKNDNIKTKGQDRDDVKAAIAKLKDSGLISSAVFRSVEVLTEIRQFGKPVPDCAGFVNMLRIPIKEGKLDEFIPVYLKSVIPHLQKFPEHCIRYIGGVARKENEWVGIAYYAGPDSFSTVTAGEPWTNVTSQLSPYLSDKPSATLFALKHKWEHQ
jgi:hypothetical protein